MEVLATTTLLLNISNPRYNLDQLSYASSVIQEYMRYKGGHCLFLDSGSIYNFDNFLNEILLSPRLTSVPRVIFNGYYKGDDAGGHYPSLLLVEGQPNVLDSFSSIYKLFYHAIDHNTRTILFAPTTFTRDVKSQQGLLISGRIHYVAVISTDERRVFYMKWMATQLVDLPYPPDISELFRYQMKDSARYDFVYSLKRRNLDIYYNPRSPIGAAVRWADETAKYLNGTSTYRHHLCHTYAKVWCACYRKFLTNNHISYSLDGSVLEDSELYFAWRMLKLSIPHRLILLMPQPELHRKDDLPSMVLGIQPVMIIFAIIMMTEVIALCLPIFTMGDALLYTLCCTSPYDLGVAKFSEKWLFIVVMLALLVTTHEYRAYIDAIMINRPFGKSIKSIDELQTFGIKIIADLLQYPELRDDARLNKLILHDSETHHRFDGKHAYLLDAELAELFLGMKINYDHRYGRRRYRQLGTSINVNVQYRVLLPMHQFLPQFAYTEKVFFESGIWQHWTNEHRWMMDERLWKKYGEKMGADDRVECLEMGDLLVAWITLAVGFSIGLIVFLMELWWNWF